MTDEQIRIIAEKVQKHIITCNCPSVSNNIEIKNNSIKLIKKGHTVREQQIDIDYIKEQLHHIKYEKNVFNGDDAIFNPLEADRKYNKQVWKVNYNRINFPKFMPVLLISLLCFGEFPTIIEFLQIYKLAYTEEVNSENIIPEDKRMSLYCVDNVNDRMSVGKELTFSNGKKMINKLIKFKDKYSCFIYGLPINEFTVENLCSRVCKVYGSLVRDIYNALYISTFGVDTYYSLLDDLLGIDLFINNIPVFAYTNTFGGQEFRQKKVSERHPNLNQGIGIKLEKNIYYNKVGDLYLIGDKTIQNIIDTINNGLNKIVSIYF